MKKVFSLILAVAMVLSLVSVALAEDPKQYITSDIAKNVPASVGYYSRIQEVSSKNFQEPNQFVFGKEYYYPIMMVDDNLKHDIKFTNTDNRYDVYSETNCATVAKNIGSLKVTADWTEGAEYIAEVGIKTVFVKTDLKVGAVTPTTINQNVYVIYIKTTGSSDETKTVVGELKVTGTPGAGNFKRDKAVDTKIPVDFQLKYEEKPLEATSGEAKLNRTGSDKYENVNFVVSASDLSKVTFNNDVTADLGEPLTDESKYLVSFNSIDDAAVVAANPDAAIMFYNIECNFRKSADITIKPIDEEGTNYLYQVLKSGAVKDLTATYDVDEEAFCFQARKLTGSYIVSDMPLAFN